MQTIDEFFDDQKNNTPLKKVSLTIIDKETLDVFYEEFDKKFGKPKAE